MIKKPLIVFEKNYWEVILLKILQKKKLQLQTLGIKTLLNFKKIKANLKWEKHLRRGWIEFLKFYF